MHNFDVRIYYEDTDAGGIVYYANYLKFMERARTEMLRAVGFESSNAHKEGSGFVVTALNIQYKSSAKLDDLITVQTKVIELGRVRLCLKQDIFKGNDLLTESEITLAMIDLDGRPVKISEDLIKDLNRYE